MYYIYVLYSKSSDKYYVGYSLDPKQRLNSHNTSKSFTYTSKHRPWVIKQVLECGLSNKEAVKIERFIKKQKSRVLIEKICDKDFELSGILAQLVRVPHLRD
jgi:putative endonuclease